MKTSGVFKKKKFRFHNQVNAKTLNENSGGHTLIKGSSLIQIPLE